MFKQILVGIDGSEQSKRAIEVSCDLAKHYSEKENASQVVLVHIPHAESAAHVVGAVAGYHAAVNLPTMSEIEEAGQKILDAGKAAAKEYGIPSAITRMQHGNAAAEILSIADEVGADLIVTGRRGLNSVSGLVLGSTSQKIGHSAKCACLSVA